MARTIFKTNPISLQQLLTDCEKGTLQLPDFQRSWVWDEDRIRSLIASISRAFPIGALMTLETGGPVDFKPRPVEGASEAAKRVRPSMLLLDGQQRMTSLYQTLLRRQVVETVTARQKKVKRWFYIDIERALDEAADREDAVIGVPEDKRITRDFGREVVLDVSTREAEYQSMLFPVTDVFDWDSWQDGLYGFDSGARLKAFRAFKNEVLENFKQYQVPVITLDRDTSKEAVCVVFEKVNTGGKPLDAFELVTAMYAADGYELRKDWYGDDRIRGRRARLATAMRAPGTDYGVLEEIASTELLQAVSLFSTREKRRTAQAEGKQGKELPAVNANRHALLALPLSDYERWVDLVEAGFVTAAKFLNLQNIYRAFDLPYQSQLVPLAAILAEIGNKWTHESVRQKLVKWYWSGVFGELYGSATETRVARDFVEVPAWIDGGEEPVTVREATFREDRLQTLRSRISAAYKGVNALLMNKGAADLYSGQRFEHTVFFGENVDIHHIFPKAWCKRHDIPATRFDSIVNKTPLSARTNRVIGGMAPSQYLRRLEEGGRDSPAIPRETLDAHLRSHLIEPDYLRADDFEGFWADRKEKLLAMIQDATGQAVYRGAARDEAEEDVVEDEVVADAVADVDEVSDPEAQLTG